MPLDDTNWPQITEVEDEATALLIRARALVGRGWCQGTYARSRLGLQVSPYSRRATQWCPSGALKAASAGASDLEYRRAVSRLSDAMGDRIQDFSDAQETVEPVLAAFDRAIAGEALSGLRRSSAAAGKPVTAGS